MQDVKKNVDRAVNLLKAIANNRRLQILCALYEGEKSVGELEQIIQLSQSALSQHLARLRKDGLVRTRRKAQTIYYSMDHSDVRAVLECLVNIFCPQKAA